MLSIRNKYLVLVYMSRNVISSSKACIYIFWGVGVRYVHICKSVHKMETQSPMLLLWRISTSTVV